MRAAKARQDYAILATGQCMCMLQGEMATYYAEQEFDNMCAADWSEFAPPIFFKMEELARKRGLQW